MSLSYDQSSPTGVCLLPKITQISQTFFHYSIEKNEIDEVLQLLVIQCSRVCVCARARWGRRALPWYLYWSRVWTPAERTPHTPSYWSWRWWRAGSSSPWSSSLSYTRWMDLRGKKIKRNKTSLTRKAGYKTYGHKNNITTICIY